MRAKELFDIIKDLYELAQKKGNMEFAQHIIGIQGILIDLAQTNCELEEKLKALQKDDEIESRIERSNGNVAQYTDEHGNKRMICTCCWDKERKLIQPQYEYSNNYRCPVCDTYSYYGEKEIRNENDNNIIGELF